MHDAMDRARRIAPSPVVAGASTSELIDTTFLAYNSARLKEACQLLAREVLKPDVTVGWTISGALTPAGLGGSCLAPLMRAGWIDWLVATGANLYHDLHHALDKPLMAGRPNLDDRELRKEGLVRIYDIVMPYEVLLSTDEFVRSTLEFVPTRPFTTPELHAVLGRAAGIARAARGVPHPTVLDTAAELSIPVFCPAPGDSSIGMNLAALSLRGKGPMIDVTGDVNLSAAIVWDAKRAGKKSAVVIVGGGTPKNFALQTEPHLQEVLGLADVGHDFMVQVTDARPDTGGLSGATPSEAVSWGKVNPDELHRTVVVYLDATVALPLLTAYLMERAGRRVPSRLLDRREDLMRGLAAASDHAVR
ncbi:MAG: deoxyhypusine synthase [Candidatus Eisenbacteria bacterium]|nr:deoxyhypusine synthase [Candidatus Eisenbacteria bacterium]